jgi:hypothetical protein
MNKLRINDVQSPHFRGVCVHVSTGYNRVEGSQRASRNGLVSDLPPEIPPVTIRTFLHRCRALPGKYTFSYPPLLILLRGVSTDLGAEAPAHLLVVADG